MKNRFMTIHRMKYVIIAISVFLSLFGAWLIRAESGMSDMQMYLIYCAVGFGLGACVLCFPVTDWIRKFSMQIYGVGIILLILMSLFGGKTESVLHGLSIGSITIPADFVCNMMIVMCLANLAEKKGGWQSVVLLFIPLVWEACFSVDLPYTVIMILLCIIILLKYKQDLLNGSGAVWIILALAVFLVIAAVIFYNRHVFQHDLGQLSSMLVKKSGFSGIQSEEYMDILKTGVPLVSSVYILTALIAKCGYVGFGVILAIYVIAGILLHGFIGRKQKKKCDFYLLLANACFFHLALTFVLSVCGIFGLNFGVYGVGTPLISLSGWNTSVYIVELFFILACRNKYLCYYRK